MRRIVRGRILARAVAGLRRRDRARAREARHAGILRGADPPPSLPRSSPPLAEGALPGGIRRETSIHIGLVGRARRRRAGAPRRGTVVRRGRRGSRRPRGVRPRLSLRQRAGHRRPDVDGRGDGIGGHAALSWSSGLLAGGPRRGRALVAGDPPAGVGERRGALAKGTRPRAASAGLGLRPTSDRAGGRVAFAAPSPARRAQQVLSQACASGRWSRVLAQRVHHSPPRPRPARRRPRTAGAPRGAAPPPPSGPADRREGQAPGEHLVQGHADAVDVGPAVHGLVAEALRRHVDGRAHDRSPRRHPRVRAPPRPHAARCRSRAPWGPPRRRRGAGRRWPA